MNKVEYLVSACEQCAFWKDGCTYPYPIMECKHFAEKLREQNENILVQRT